MSTGLLEKFSTQYLHSFWNCQRKVSYDIFIRKEISMKLHVVIEKDESGYFVAEVPALPGCFSQGKTHEEALTNIKEAIEGWFEVMESKQSFDRTPLFELTV